MLLHFSRTVLVAIFWTILLYRSTETTKSEEARVLGFRNNSKAEHRLESIDRHWNRENRSEAIENDEPNVETRLPSDSDVFIAKDDMVEDAIAIVVEKCHVRELSLSQETASNRVSTENEMNNTYPGTGEYPGSENDDDSLFQRYPEAPFDLNSRAGSIDAARGIDNGISSSEGRGLTVSRDRLPNDTRTEDSDVAPDKFPLKDGVHKGGALNLSETLANTVSLIINSNPPVVNSQSENSRVDMFTGENHHSTSGNVAENESANQRNGFLGFTPLNDISSEKYHPFSEKMKSSKGARGAKHEGLSSQESRDTLSFFYANVETENIGGGKNRRRKKSTGYVRNSSTQIPMPWENDHDRNVGKVIAGKNIGRLISGVDGIYAHKMNEKPGYTRTVKDPSIVNDIATKNRQAIKDAEFTEDASRRSQKEYETSGFFETSTNRLEKKVRSMISDSSVDNVNSGLFTSGEISRESATGNLVEIHKSSETGHQRAKMSSSKENSNEDYAQTLMQNSSGRLRNPTALNENKQDGASLEITESHHQDEEKKRKKEDYRGEIKDGHTSASSLPLSDKLSERNIRTVIISGEKGSLMKDTSMKQRYDHSANQPRFESLPTLTYENKISPRSRKSSILSTNPHMKSGIHENVVKTKMMGLQRDREARKTFIGRKSGGDIDPRSYQKRGMQVRMQKRKKYAEKPTAGRRDMETDGFFGQKKKKASWFESLVNSKASPSLRMVGNRVDNPFDSITSTTAGDARKMESSSTGESFGDSRKAKIVPAERRSNRVIFSTKSIEVNPGSVQYLRPSTENGPFGNDNHVFSNKREDAITTTSQPTRIVASSTMGSSVVEVHSRNFVIAGLHEDHHVRNETAKVLELPENKRKGKESSYRLRGNDQREILSKGKKKPKFDSTTLSADHVSGIIFNDTVCETCVNLEILDENPSEPEKFGFGDRRGTETIAATTNDTFVSRKTTKSNKFFVNFNFIGEGFKSLKSSSTGPKVTEISIPVEKQRESRHVPRRGEDSIMSQSMEKNIAVPEEVTYPRRPELAKVGKSSGSNGRRASSEKILDQGSKSFLLLNPEMKTRGQSSRAAKPAKLAKPANNETNMVIQLFTQTLKSRKQDDVHNNASSISEDQANTRLNFTSPGESESGSNASWKLLVNDDATAMSSRKIDSSLASTDQTSYSNASQRREDFVEKSQPGSWSSERYGVVAKLLNAGTKQGKGGFTTDDIRSDFTAKATVRHFRDHETFANTAKSRDRDAKATDATDDESRTYDSSSSRNSPLSENDKFFSNSIPSSHTAGSSNSSFLGEEVKSYNSMDFDLTSDLSRTNSTLIEKNALSENHQQPRDKIISATSVDLENENSLSTGTGNHDWSFGSSIFKRIHNSSNASSRDTESLNLPLQEPVTVEATRGTRNTRTLNQTTYDNSTRITAALNQWPVKRSAVVEGDLVLGSLMMVHEREDSVTCGPVMPQGGVQALEAMLYTLDWLNKRDLVPGVKIGAHILDDCDKDTYGLEMAVDFIKAGKRLGVLTHILIVMYKRYGLYHVTHFSWSRQGLNVTLFKCPKTCPTSETYGTLKCV